MKKGVFITIEGTDGSGKSTQLENIQKYLIGKGHDVVTVREPGGTDIGEKIRKIILDPANINMDKITEILLYEAARAQIVKEVIRPAIVLGKTVICDRYIDSTLAYQGYGRNIDIDKIHILNEIATQGLAPDITFLFAISPQEAISRKKKHSAPDRMEMENNDFRQKVYDGYLHIADSKQDRIKIIDAGGSVEEVFLQVRDFLDELNI